MGNGCEALGAADLTPQRGGGNPQDQHAVGAGEHHFVAAGAVAEREVAGAQYGLAPVLAADALALELQMQEEHRVPGARHMRARMAHDLGVGIHFGESHVADGTAHDGAVENPDVLRFGDQRRKTLAGPIIPERELAARIQADRRERFNLCHITPRSLPETVFAVPGCLCCRVGYT